MILQKKSDKKLLKKYLSNTKTAHYQEYLCSFDKNYCQCRSNCFNDENATFFHKENNDKYALIKFKESQWDSKTFGLKVADLEVITGLERECDRELIEEVRKYALDQNIQLLKCRIGYDSFSSIHALEDCGFRMVDAMNIFLWDRDKNNIHETKENHSIQIQVEQNPADIEDIVRIAQFSFTKGRINNDPGFNGELTGKFYDSFAKSFTSDGKTLVTARKDGKIVGFVTGEQDDFLNRFLKTPLGYLSMISVDPQTKGEGVGSLLLANFLHIFSKQVRYIEIGTQINNYPALNLYSSNGIKLASSLITLHLWNNK